MNQSHDTPMLNPKSSRKMNQSHDTPMLNPLPKFNENKTQIFESFKQ